MKSDVVAGLGLQARRPGTQLLPALTLACIPVCLISLALVEADLAVTSAIGVRYLALNGVVVVTGGMVCYTLGCVRACGQFRSFGHRTRSIS